MAKYQVSPTLIDQIQISLRKEAHLESFNPNDPSLPSPPSLDEVIANFDTGSDHLRCKHCKGALLRGLESIICVYCGHDQHPQPTPQPIPFKSTLGFNLLLQSLHLDKSESVGLSAGDTQSNSVQSSQKGEISISDLLDLELKWPDESKELRETNEAQLPGKRHLNFVGVNVDDLIREGSIDHASHRDNEQEVAGGKFETKETTTISGQSLSLFENTESLEAGLKSVQGELDQSSNWEAEFQSASPDTEHEHLQSSDVSKDPPVNYAPHADSMLGLAEQEKSANFSNSHITSRSNLTDSDLDSNSGPHFHPTQSEHGIRAEDIGKVTESVTASSNFDWSPKDQQETTRAGPPHDEKRDGVDSLNEWETVFIRSENNQSKPSSKAPHDCEGSGEPDISDAWNDFTASVGVEHDQLEASTVKVPDDNSLFKWNNSTTPAYAEDNQLETRSIEMLGENNVGLLDGTNQDQPNFNMTCNQAAPVGLWSNINSALQDDQLQARGTNSSVSGTAMEVNDLYDYWDDFKGSAVGRQQEADNIGIADNKVSGDCDSTYDAWNDFASLGARNNEQKISSAKPVDNDRSDSHVDSFAAWNDNSLDAWNDFTSSTGVSDSKTIDNDISFGAWNDLSGSTFINAHQDQSSGAGAENSRVFEEEGSFHSWSDFSISKKQAENSFSIPKVSQDQINLREAPKTETLVEDNSPFESWGEFSRSTPIQMQSHAGGAEQSDNKIASGGHDFFRDWSVIGGVSNDPSHNQLISNGVTKHDDKPKSENDKSFDTWNDFTSSSYVQTNTWITSSTNVPNDKEAAEQSEPFSTWDVFVTSPNVQAGNEIAVGKENTSGKNLLNTSTDSRGVEPNSPMHPDLSLGALSDQSHSSQVAVSCPKGPDSFRRENGDAKAEGYSEQMIQSENASDDTLDLKSSNIETLISEMHHLSFMLESSLSIPKSTT